MNAIKKLTTSVISANFTVIEWKALVVSLYPSFSMSVQVTYSAGALTIVALLANVAAHATDQ